MAVAAMCWIAVVLQARPMDGMAIGLGTFSTFAWAWTLMIGAMMLPSAIPFIRGTTTRF